jgi:arylsulfatase A-like enzyme
MNRRVFLKSVLGHTALLSGIYPRGKAWAAERMNDKRPNVLLIFSDDQRFNTIHELGNVVIHTPNLDYLVREGTCFTRAYMMGSMSGATCIPSRAMLLSGRSLFHLDGNGRNIPPTHTTIPEALHKNGYYSYWVGKSHQAQSSMGRMFDGGSRCYGYHGPYRDYDHYLMGTHDFDPSGKFDGPLYIYRKGPQGQEVKTLLNRENFKEMKARANKEAEFFHTSEVFTTGAVNFLKRYEQEKPFFLYLAYHAPHDPRNAPQRFHDMYPLDEIPLPASFKPEHPFDQGSLKIRDEKLAGFPRKPDEIKKHLADYYAIISHMDEQIGRVLKILKETGLDENTLVIFSGDSGLAVGNHGLMGKQNLYDAGGIHVPLIFKGPGIRKSQKRQALCYLFDVMPTICDLTNTSIPASCDGKSLASIIRGSEKKVRSYQYFAYTDTQRAVQDDRYKLIEYAHKGKRFTQLFDLKSDPDEIQNLIDDRRYSGHRDRLKAELQRLKKVYGDEI